MQTDGARRTPRAAAVTVGLLAAAVVVSGGLALRPGGSLPMPAARPAVSSLAGAAPAVPLPAPESDGGGGDVVLTSNDVAAAGLAARSLPRAATSWVTSVSVATGIGAVALQAYADSALVLAAERPGCKVGWTTLAAIGAIESGHGTTRGSALAPDGRAVPTIVGPALDGRPGFAAIRASAAGTSWHGDTRWEHAVGPLQFLPSTWARWGADGDGDGTADPDDIDDASLAAGRYLCASGRDLTTGDAWWSAVLSYNHSEDYAALVRARAGAYASASLTAATGS